VVVVGFLVNVYSVTLYAFVIAGIAMPMIIRPGVIVGISRKPYLILALFEQFFFIHIGKFQQVF
jgi:hypothetical protein